MFGRNRDSITGIQLEVQSLFEQHPEVSFDEEGKPLLPVSVIPEILRNHEAEGTDSILNDEELEGFMNILQSTGKPVDVDTIVKLYAIKSKNSNLPEYSEQPSQEDSDSEPPPIQGTSEQSGDTHPSIPLKGPIEFPDSPFETKNRQRSRPLLPPSSFTSRKPLPASQSGRRRSESIAYPLSDSESPGSITAVHKRERSRAPSNPVSPSPNTTHFGTFSPEPLSPYSSRPSSRAQSRNGYFSQFETPLHVHSSSSYVSNAASPPANDHQDDDGEYEFTARLGRLDTSSSPSLDLMKRIEDLNRANDELNRKLIDVERTLAAKLEASDLELAELESKLEDLRQELASKNREEKELRVKERASAVQMQAMESEVAKLQRNLENSRIAFTTLHKQYQEQMVESERYRDALRQKDEEMKEMSRLSMRNAHDAEQRDQNRLASELRVAQLEEELMSMREAEGNLDLQKAENLLLKETIDRLRFELDELTNNTTTGSIGVGPSSHAGTISKSLGAEFSRMNQYENRESNSEPVKGNASGDSTEGEEEEIQTIIRRKRKVAGRKGLDLSIEEVTKEYLDSSAQTLTTELGAKDVQSEAEDHASSSKPILLLLQGQTEPSLYADSPPSYTPMQSAGLPAIADSSLERDPSESKVLKAWHPSRHLSLDEVPGGVSRNTLENWQAIKDELGIECHVIDRALTASLENGSGREIRNDDSHGRRFYNIYNTYIYGDMGGSAATSLPLYIAGGAIIVLAIQPFLPVAYFNPAMPNYIDRLGWNNANNLTPRGLGFDETSRRTTIKTTISFFRMLLTGAQIIVGRFRPMVTPT